MQSSGWNNRPWQLPHKTGVNRTPVYIAVGGNTGSGKSTLVREIGKLFDKDRPHITIDERDTHHPFLDRLFHDPSNYAFHIQLNFMIQRSLLVKRWLDCGYSLVMERSHVEDTIFIKFLLEQKLINRKQYVSYMNVWNEINAVTPLPDILILLDVEPEESIHRIAAAEQKKERPIEFPNDDIRAAWIKGWSIQYRELAKKLSISEDIRGRLQIYDNIGSPAATANRVFDSLNRR